MKCPYLSISPKKRCINMTEEKMDEELTDFDLKHFCEGKPIYCYYFRKPAIKPRREPPKQLSPTEEKLQLSTINGY